MTRLREATRVRKLGSRPRWRIDADSGPKRITMAQNMLATLAQPTGAPPYSPVDDSISSLRRLRSCVNAAASAPARSWSSRCSARR
eukprot:109237-Pleurochrysis_carterae.AAC.1